MTADVIQPKGRFDALINGTGLGLYDKPLLESADWLVAPTLGSIVPGWFLVIPRKKFLSFKEWQSENSFSIDTIIMEILEYFDVTKEDIIWFEHGPSRANTRVGCGIDHAHIHILIKPQFSFSEFEKLAKASTTFQWYETPYKQRYSSVPTGQSYLIAGSGQRVVYATNVESAGSQFFRRIIANIVKKESEWDYKSFPHEENIMKTVLMLPIAIDGNGDGDGRK